MSTTDFSIPLVDLEDLTSPHVERQQKAAKAIRTAFGTYGLIYISNHGIEADALGLLHVARHVVPEGAAKGHDGKAIELTGLDQGHDLEDLIQGGELGQDGLGQVALHLGLL